MLWIVFLISKSSSLDIVTLAAPLFSSRYLTFLVPGIMKKSPPCFCKDNVLVKQIISSFFFLLGLEPKPKLIGLALHPFYLPAQ
jgi:hypothetical protein